MATSEPEKGEEIGNVIEYSKSKDTAKIKLYNTLKVGDKIRIEGGGQNFETNVASIQMNGEEVPEAKEDDEVMIPMPEDVGSGYKIYKA